MERFDLNGLLCTIDNLNIRTEKYATEEGETHYQPAVDIALSVNEVDGERWERFLAACTMRDGTGAKRWTKDANKICKATSFLAQFEDHRVIVNRAHGELFDGEAESATLGMAKVNKFAIAYGDEDTPAATFRVQCQISGQQVAPVIDLLNAQVQLDISGPGSNG